MIDDNEGGSGYELDLTPMQEEIQFPSNSNIKKQCKRKSEEFIIAEDVEEFFHMKQRHIFTYAEEFH